MEAQGKGTRGGRLQVQEAHLGSVWDGDRHHHPFWLQVVFRGPLKESAVERNLLFSFCYRKRIWMKTHLQTGDYTVSIWNVWCGLGAGVWGTEF